MKFKFAKCWNNKGPRRDKQTKKLETRGSFFFFSERALQ